MAMPLASQTSSTAAASRGNPRAAPHEMVWLDRRHPERADLERFIAGMFLKRYGARVSHFCDILVGCRNSQGEWIAALGYSPACKGPVYLEQYLHRPLESEIAACTCRPVSRQHIVEVGNMAAAHAGAARELIVSLTRHLYQCGYIWVAFTATRGLLNSFARLHLQPQVLCDADPARLPGDGKNWGSYYDTRPAVVFGDIHSGHARLAG